MNYLIGIDIGTSATKTVLFDQDGTVVSSMSKDYPLSQPQNGWAEQNPEDWANAAIFTLREVIRKSGINPSDIKGIGLSGQMHGLVMLDEQGEPLRPSIIWCDQRTTAECDEMTRIVGRDRLIEITANPALTGFTASKIMWVKKHEPELYAKCRHILLPKDYVRYCLTGAFATEVSDASGMQLLDVKNRCWSDELLKLLDIDKSLLASVHESPEITGYITTSVAEKTGLAAGTPVAGGAGDNAAAAVGTGVVKDGKAFTTIGSSGVVYAHTDRPLIDPLGRVHTFCCAVPGCWHVMGVTQGAGLSLKWFCENFCTDLIEEANTLGMDIYALTDQKASNVPIGSNRLIYLPYLMGERTPHLNADCRGVFFGLSAIHGNAELIRAVMEGVSFSLKDCVDVLTEMGVSTSEMLACGGGGKSSFWRQMLADVYNTSVQTISSTEGPALGAAILAGVGTGMYQTVTDACEHLVKIKSSTAPNESAHGKYTELHKLYKKLYCDLKESFSLLQKM